MASLAHLSFQVGTDTGKEGLSAKHGLVCQLSLKPVLPAQLQAGTLLCLRQQLHDPLLQLMRQWACGGFGRATFEHVEGPAEIHWNPSSTLHADRVQAVLSKFQLNDGVAAGPDLHPDDAWCSVQGPNADSNVSRLSFCKQSNCKQTAAATKIFAPAGANVSVEADEIDIMPRMIHRYWEAAVVHLAERLLLSGRDLVTEMKLLLSLQIRLEYLERPAAAREGAVIVSLRKTAP